MAQNSRRSQSVRHNDTPATPGEVVAAFGRQFEIRTASGHLLCHTRGRNNQYACGDVVEVSPAGDGLGVIETLLPRRNLLWRSDAFRQKLLAANLTRVVIVVATEPGFSDLLVSRCLTAAESEDIPALIALNKSDLTAGLPDARARLKVFTSLGYPVIELCALEQVDALASCIDGERALLVGQSGMGKSTLINALVPEALAVTREISTALDTGKHTTTLTRLYPRGKGCIIDSPGLQAFGLAHLTPEAIESAFVEFHPLLGQCRFRNCRHDKEPGCALTEAVAKGIINTRRFEHFLQIRDEVAYARNAHS